MEYKSTLRVAVEILVLVIALLGAGAAIVAGIQLLAGRPAMEGLLAYGLCLWKGLIILAVIGALGGICVLWERWTER